MLRFTAAGVVAAPRAVQLRVTGDLRGGVLIGVEPCAKPMTDDEITANVRYFTLGQRGPRGAVCEALILSAVPPERLQAIGACVREARAWGIRRVVLHAAAADLGRVDEAVDEVVVVARGEAIGPCARPVTLVVTLEEGGEALALRSVEAISGVARVVFSWPFPPAGRPMDVREVKRLLDGAGERLEGTGVPWTVKGIPGCLLGSHQGRHARTQNRWYVDAEHQTAHARLFFPDLLRFSKLDVCRFCRLDERCDGVAAKWLDHAPLTPLRPVVDTR
jgi:hypothetical protein